LREFEPDTYSCNIFFETGTGKGISLMKAYALVASSSVKVPSTLVRMNAPGPWMLRSTWLSAAK
jgi:hypothetical protein